MSLLPSGGNSIPVVLWRITPLPLDVVNSGTCLPLASGWAHAPSLANLMPFLWNWSLAECVQSRFIPVMASWRACPFIPVASVPRTALVSGLYELWLFRFSFNSVTSTSFQCVFFFLPLKTLEMICVACNKRTLTDTCPHPRWGDN